MSALREAAQQALWVIMTYGTEPQMDAARALRAALEQPEQAEPVAWMVYTQDGKSVCVTDNPADFIEWRSFPLFTHPPRREWRSLSEEEVDELQSGMQASHKDVRAIEAALRSKNHE